MLLFCCEKIVDFFIIHYNLSATQRQWYIYSLETRIVMFFSIISMLLLGSLVSSISQVICFLLSILSLRRWLGGYHAQTPLRCLFLSMVVTIACLCFVNLIIKYNWDFLIWTTLIILSIAVFNSYPYTLKNCPRTSDELAISWRKSKQLLAGDLSIAVVLQIIPVDSNYVHYWAMGIIAAAISFFVAKLKKE